MAPTPLHFKDRREAGKLLAERLKYYAEEEVVVYALPRGGLPVGAEVARSLGAPLDILTARKVGHPDFPEYAIAAVGEEGYVVKNDEAVVSIGEDRFDELVENAQVEARHRHNLYLHGMKRPDVKGKIAIVVDDGLATGLTIKAAISDLKTLDPRKIVVAVPVSPDVAIGAMSDEADEFVVLYPDPNFIAIGSYYDEFGQVSDEEVVKILKSANKEV